MKAKREPNGRPQRPTVKDEAGLTPKMERFCHEYLVDLNASAAAIRAGYAKSGARQHGAKLLQTPAVEKLVAELKAKQLQKVDLRADDILRGLLEVFQVDIADLYDERGHLKNIHDIPKSARKAMAAIDVFEEFEGTGDNREKVGETRKVKLWDKLKAGELLGEHLKLWARGQTSITVEIDLAGELRKARERVANR